jgi:diacylglycerol kinase (ATP)
MKPIGLVINPTANRGKGKQTGELLKQVLAERGLAFVDLSGATAAAALDRSAEAISNQELSGVVAVGGDGTAQLGVNLAVPNQVPFGLVPAGSGNDQARELGIPLGDPAAAVQNIIDGMKSPRRVDVMRVKTDSRELWSIGSVSGGFDALCAKRANGLKWPKGPNSYVAAMLLELPKFKPIAYQLEIDGETREIRAMLCGVANVKNFGGGMMISPNSEIADGNLELFILHEVSRPRLLKIFPSVYKGEHLRYPEVEIVSVKSVRIANSGYPVSCDGELIGNAPFSVQLSPAGLAVWSR